jgi:hypothetical protein
MHEQLDRYRLQGRITPTEHAAGLRFSEDHRAARRWRDQRRGEDRAAATRYAQACAELDDLRSVSVAVCVVGLGASTWAERMDLPRSAGLSELQQALRVLVRFYSAADARAA